MPKIWLGLLGGLLFGVLDVLFSLPVYLPDKKTTLILTFISRLLTGFFIGTTNLPLTPPAAGCIIGGALSLLSPTVSRTGLYALHITIGIGGGILIAGIVSWLGI
ncbi:hypothetical protein HZB07_06320 [Candidatus Saganbacteria bacterium]|nr:hypothetical protein [Candidatus Saganbacteria bacterium]